MASTSTQTVEIPERQEERVENTAPLPETQRTDFVIKLAGAIPF
ncbi:MAG: hypothetical protein ACRD1B_01950 [Thermoanaerobaculia bacterium]